MRQISLNCLFLFLAAGCSKKQETPFVNPIRLTDSLLYSEYLKDEKLADSKYKGKKIGIERSFGWGEVYQPKIDQSRKYIPGFLGKDGEVFRYYLREGEWLNNSSGSERCCISGICKGLKNGVIILEQCEVNCGGGDW